MCNNREELLSKSHDGKNDLIESSNIILTVIEHSKKQQQNLDIWNKIGKSGKLEVL